MSMMGGVGLLFCGAGGVTCLDVPAATVKSARTAKLITNPPTRECQCSTERAILGARPPNAVLQPQSRGRDADGQRGHARLCRLQALVRPLRGFPSTEHRGRRAIAETLTFERVGLREALPGLRASQNA